FFLGPSPPHIYYSFSFFCRLIVAAGIQLDVITTLGSSLCAVQSITTSQSLEEPLSVLQYLRCISILPPSMQTAQRILQ
uniref:Uncharacterized protein n=1 Tax=Aegilops tauschii subsp. strangulata TaxID=200361 RepID=A0A453GSH0_AEGTS